MRKIYIEPETIKKANDNLKESLKAAHEVIATGTPEEIKAQMNDVLQRSQDLRAFLCANYNIKFR